jgi:pimeloyl-ACP methyl ester carboxylesterase
MSNKSLARLIRIGVIATLALTAFLPARGADAATSSCRAVKAPVTLGPEPHKADFIYGELCSESGASPTTVVLMVNGATYNHLYWDFPYQPDRYSMVRALTGAGYATFAIDQIDAGQSSHPLSVRVTTQREATALHQLIHGLRAGRLGTLTFASFTRVVTGGHSSGSVAVLAEANKYRDVDGVIVTGAAIHHANPPGLLGSAAQLRPATLDPKFADSGLDPGYMTVTPKFRQKYMHEQSDVDPNVVAIDEANKDTVTATAEVTILPAILRGTFAIEAPVLIAEGGHDVQFCGGVAGECTPESLTSAEAPFYPNAASLEAYVLPGAGHAMNLALNATEWYAAAVDWLDRRVPS